MEEKKTKNNKIWIVFLVGLAIVAVLYFAYELLGSRGTYKISFPFTESVVNNSTFSCEALIDSDITGSPLKSLTYGIEATVGKGVNKVSLQIKDEKTLSFLSGASFDTGETEGVDFSIVKNDNKELVAAMWNGTSMNTVVLDKKNGLAIWTKSRSDFPVYGAPSVDLSYLICR